MFALLAAQAVAASVPLTIVPKHAATFSENFVTWDAGPDRDAKAWPLHRWRTWNRGFNQSALIARHLARALAMPVAMEALVRVRRTPPLKGLGPVERARTVRGAFRPGRDVEQIRGRTVILIDDVMTSGATANACAAMLKKSGAAQVHLLCWARVLQEDAAGLSPH